MTVTIHRQCQCSAGRCASRVNQPVFDLAITLDKASPRRMLANVERDEPSGSRARSYTPHASNNAKSSAIVSLLKSSVIIFVSFIPCATQSPRKSRHRLKPNV
jgi:hypothetical protein